MNSIYITGVKRLELYIHNWSESISYLAYEKAQSNI